MTYEYICKDGDEVWTAQRDDVARVLANNFEDVERAFDELHRMGAIKLRWIVITAKKVEEQIPRERALLADYYYRKLLALLQDSESLLSELTELGTASIDVDELVAAYAATKDYDMIISLEDPIFDAARRIASDFASAKLPL